MHLSNYLCLMPSRPSLLIKEPVAILAQFINQQEHSMAQNSSSAPVIRAPRGSSISCRGWHQEAAMRMLMNNLDPEVAEHPDKLVVYGGTGKAARNWDSYHAIIRTLKQLGNEETLLVQSGKPVGVIRTHDQAPRVLIANSNLVGRWANWQHFRDLEARGLTMYGQMTAGSWIYIGSQGLVQGTYETFAELARQHFEGSLKGRLTVTAGLGGMGGARPLAVTMDDGHCLAVAGDESRIDMRGPPGYRHGQAKTPDEALDIIKSSGQPVSVGPLGDMGDGLPGKLRRGIAPAALADHTAADDLRQGYIPAGMTLHQAADMR